MVHSMLLAVLAVTVVQTIATDPPCAKRWIKKGCFQSLHSDLIVLFDERHQNKINWDDLDSHSYDFACRCRQKALQSNYEWFAMAEYGLCLAGRGTFNHYIESRKIGLSPECVSTKKNVVVSDVDGEICFGGRYDAYFYQVVKDSGAVASAPQAEEEMAAEEEAVKCTHKSDVLLIADVSGSVGENNFSFMKGFFLEFLKRYDFTSSRLGIITFDEKCYVNLMWSNSKGMSLDQLRQYINDMKYTAGSTLTDNALKCARDKIIKHSKVSNVPITLFVMTDGTSFRGEELIPPIAEELRNTYGCKMISIGVGSQVNDDELKMIAGNNENLVFKISDFKNLIELAAKHLNNIISKACT